MPTTRSALTRTLTYIHGSHNWKLGAGVSAYQNNTVYDFYVNGEFDFYGSSTYVGSGYDLADFLMGNPDEYYQFGRGALQHPLPL